MTRTAILRGAAKLDELLGPEWDELVNLDKLNIRDPKHCVLGEVFGEYNVGTRFIFKTFATGERFGFETTWVGGASDYQPLTKEWREHIIARRCARMEGASEPT